LNYKGRFWQAGKSAALSVELQGENIKLQLISIYLNTYKKALSTAPELTYYCVYSN